MSAKTVNIYAWNFLVTDEYSMDDNGQQSVGLSFAGKTQ